PLTLLVPSARVASPSSATTCWVSLRAGSVGRVGRCSALVSGPHATPPSTEESTADSPTLLVRSEPRRRATNTRCACLFDDSDQAFMVQRPLALLAPRCGTRRAGCSGGLPRYRSCRAAGPAQAPSS